MGYFDKFDKKVAISGIPNMDMNIPLSPQIVKGDVGLEFEVEGRGLPSGGDLLFEPCPVTGATWHTHVDNSLRGESLEYVLTGPAEAEYSLNLIHQLYKKFNDSGTVLNLSNRCSTHVHLNVSSWKVDKLSALIVLWSLFEEALINWNGIERKTNHFCLGNSDTPELTDHWVDFLNTGAWQFHDGSKYTALNLLHIHDFGSVEVRCGRGFNSLEDATNWVSFLIGLYEYSASTRPDLIPSLVSEHQPDRMFQDICENRKIPEFFQQVMDCNPNFNMKAIEAFRDVQKICYAYPWEEWLELINKVHIKNPFSEGKEGRAPSRRDLVPVRFNDLPRWITIEEPQQPPPEPT